MRIILISDVFPPDYHTSVGSITINLANEFIANGHQVLIIATTGSKNEAGLKKYGNLDVWRIYANFPSRLRPYLSLCNPWVVPFIKKIFKEFNPEIIHIQFVHHLLSYYCLKLAKNNGAKVFLTAHDTNLIYNGKLNHFINRDDLSIPVNFKYKISWWREAKELKARFVPLRRIIIKYYLKHVDKIFAVSNSLKQALADNGMSNVAVVYNGIDLDNYQVEPSKIKEFMKKYELFGKKIIFFGGRLSYLKGGEEIIKALYLIKEKIPNVVLLVAGEKSGYWGKMENLINNYNLQNHVIGAGWLSFFEMMVAYNIIDVCVTPSIYLDPFNLFNIEAMANKKPVVGTCFGGTPEIVVDNKTGYIVNPFNTELLAEKITDLLNNPLKAEQFGQAGYERVKSSFSFKKMTAEILTWYQKNYIM